MPVSVGRVSVKRRRGGARKRPNLKVGDIRHIYCYNNSVSCTSIMLTLCFDGRDKEYRMRMTRAEDE
jgi:hypothetical protein